jgi:hypothetical protein
MIKSNKWIDKATSFIATNRFPIAISILLAVLTFFVVESFTSHWHTAICLHANIASVYAQNLALPCYFLYYLSIYIVAGFSSSVPLLFKASAIVLAIAMLAKYFMAYWYIKDKNNNILIPCILALFLWLAHPLLFTYNINSNLYLGTIDMNIWHNSTIMFIYPLAIALFMVSLKYIQTGDNKKLWLILLLAVINIYAKPSFYFVFAGIFPLMVFFKYKKSEQSKNTLIFSALIFGFFLIQYYWLYHDKILTDIIYKGEKSDIAITFLMEWKLISKHIIFDLLRSIAFPLAFSLCFFDKIRRNSEWIYSFLMFIVGMLIFIFVQETGPRFGHANFIWQANIALFIWFFACIRIWHNDLLHRNFLWKKTDILPLLFLLWHVVSGIIYIAKLLVVHDFL